MQSKTRKALPKTRDQRAVFRLLMALLVQFIVAFVFNQFFSIGYATWLIIIGIVFMGIVGGPPERLQFFGSPNLPLLRNYHPRHLRSTTPAEWFPADLWVGIFPILVGVLILHLG